MTANKKFDYDDDDDEPIMADTTVIAAEVPVVATPFTPVPASQVEDHESEGFQNDDHDDDARMVGAGVATGVLAFIFCGPILAIFAGVGAAFGTTRPGAAGDISRAVGDVAMRVRDKAKKIDKDHQIVERTQQTVKEQTEKHRFLKRAGESLNNIGQRVKLFDERHNVVGRTGRGVWKFWEGIVSDGPSRNERDVNTAPVDVEMDGGHLRPTGYVAVPLKADSPK